MSIQDIITALADKVLAHCGTKVRYSVQIKGSTGWRDLNQTWHSAKKVPFSVTRTVADARLWKNRYDAATKKSGMQIETRIVRQVTQFDVVA